MSGILHYISSGEPGGIVDADFLEFYQLDLKSSYSDDKWRTYGLIGNLPTKSRTVQSSIGGEMLTYSDLMLAKIEFLIRSFIWASSDSRSRGSKPEIDIPDYIININNTNQDKLTKEDLLSAYDWIYDPSFEQPLNNYN